MDTKPILQKSAPYLLAIVIFLVIAFAYCSPVIDGKVVHQTDVTQAIGMQKEMADYHKKTGKYTLWTDAMFGGMPTYQIGKVGVPDYNIFSKLAKVVRLYHILPPHSVSIIFLYMLGFFILLLSFRVNPWLAIVGSIAFALSSYNIIIILAGHINKALALGMMPAVIGGFILVYRKKYIIGGIVSTLSLGIHLFFNHVQMTYYLIITLIILFLVYLVYAIIRKELRSFFISTAILAGCYVLAVMPNAPDLYITYEYSKDTIRGKSDLTSEPSEKTTGLSKSYAYSWSYDKWETFTLLVPDFKGGASPGTLSEKSNMYKALINHGMPRENARQWIEQAPTYWGEQAFTYGPVYFGAVICFLFVLGLFLIGKKQKWWILITIVLSILLSWGGHMEWFSDIFFYHVPLYNKFRAVSTILVIPSILFPLVAFLGIRNLISGKHTKQDLLKYLKYTFYITGGLLAFFLILGPGLFSFQSPHDTQFEKYPWLMNAIYADRKSLFRTDTFRSLVFVSLTAGALWLYIKDRLKINQFYLLLAALIIIDLWSVDKRYLNNDDFQSKRKAWHITPTQADLQILQDKDPDYRVFNLTSNPFTEAQTSYFHKSIGGYHAAKLMRYQELIEHDLSKQNMKVIDMLNTKYFIVPDKKTHEPMAERNPGALGNVWFVDSLQIVNNADQEIAALDYFDPATTAVMEKKYLDKLPDPASLDVDSVPSSASIKLVSYEPNDLVYEANTPRELFAVFSEIYYDNNKGWHAYLDGKKVQHVRVNFVLRGMPVPEGKHKIEFKFHPEMFYKGLRVTLISSIVVSVFILSFLLLLVMRKLKSPVEDQKGNEPDSNGKVKKN